MAEDISVLGIAVETKGVKEGADALDNLTKSGARAEVATEKLTNKIAGLATIAKASAAAFGVFKIAEYAKDSTLLAARYETLGVAMEQIGKNVGYSSDQMNAFAAGVQKAGISMLESRATLTKMALAHIDLADASKLAAVAQGAAVVAGINSSEAMGRMIQGIQSGQIETLRAIGINVNFEASYAKMADQIGLNVTLLTETEKAQARSNAVLEKGGDLASVYEKAMGTAGKQMGTLARYTEDLSVKMGGAFLETFTNSIFGQSEALKVLGSEMDNLANNGSVERFGHSLAEGVWSAIDPIKSATKYLYEHRDAVEMVAGAYVALKVGSFAGPLIAQYAAATAAAANYTAAIVSGKMTEGSARLAANAIITASAEAESMAMLAATNAQVAHARATVIASEGAVQLALAENMLVPALQKQAAASAVATAATTANAEAMAATAASSRAAGVASSALGTATAALGGPIGIVITMLGTAALAWSIFGDNGKKAASDIDNALDIVARKNKERKFGTGDVGGLSAGAAGANEQLASIKAQIKAEESWLAALPASSMNSGVDMVSVSESKISSLKAKADQVSASIKEIDANLATAKSEAEKNTPTPGKVMASSERLDTIAAKYAPKITKEQTLASLEVGYKAAQEAAKGNATELLAIDQKYKTAKAGIDESFKKSSAPADAEGKSQLSFDIDKIKRNSDDEIAVYSNADKIMSAMRSANMIDEARYYEWQAEKIQAVAANEENTIKQQIDRMQKEKLTGKAAIDNAKAIMDAEAKLQKVREDANTASVVNGIQATGAVNAITKAYDSARASAEAYLATVAKQYQREIDGIGKGDKYRSDQSGLNRIEDNFTSQRNSLFAQFNNKEITPETQAAYDTYLAIAQAAYERDVSMYKKSRSEISAAQADWKNGATEAMANYAESARNAAARANEAFTNSIKSMEDALVSFVTTGKLDFKSLADTIIAEMARTQIRQILGGASGGLAGLMGSSATTGYEASSDTMFSSAGSGIMGWLSSLKMHTGGIVGTGEGSGFSSVDPRIFHGASKYHTGGIVDGEVPIIAKRGEGVFTAGQMKAMKPANDPSASGAITIVNQTSAKIGTVTEQRLSNGERALIIQEAVDATAAQFGDPNSKTSRSFSRNYTAQRTR